MIPPVTTQKAVSARPIRGRLQSSRSQPLGRQVQAHIAQPVESDRYVPASQHLANTPGGCPRVTDAGADFFAVDTRPVILFDGECNLCNGGVQFVLDWDSAETYRFASLQSDAGRALLKRSGRSPDDISSIVLVSKQRHWIKSTAVLKIAEELKAPVPILSAFLQPVPGLVRDSVYKFVSENRYMIFGQADQCRMMIPEWRARFLS